MAPATPAWAWTRQWARLRAYATHQLSGVDCGCYFWTAIYVVDTCGSLIQEITSGKARNWWEEMMGLRTIMQEVPKGTGLWPRMIYCTDNIKLCTCFHSLGWILLAVNDGDNKQCGRPDDQILCSDDPGPLPQPHCDMLGRQSQHVRTGMGRCGAWMGSQWTGWCGGLHLCTYQPDNGTRPQDT